MYAPCCGGRNGGRPQTAVRSIVSLSPRARGSNTESRLNFEPAPVALHVEGVDRNELSDDNGILLGSRSPHGVRGSKFAKVNAALVLNLSPSWSAWANIPRTIETRPTCPAVYGRSGRPASHDQKQPPCQMRQGGCFYMYPSVEGPRRVWQGGPSYYIGCCVWSASRIHPTPCTAQTAASPFSGTAPRKGPGRPGWPAQRTRSSQPYSHPGRARTASKAPA